MPEFQHIQPAPIDLRDNAFKPRFGIPKTWRQLKQETPHAPAKQIRDEAKISYQFGRSGKTLHMRDQFAHLYRVDKPSTPRLPIPRVDRPDHRPGIKWRVQFHRAKRFRIVRKPLIAGKPARIESPAPMPVIPAGAA